MGLADAIVEFTEKQPKLVAVALLGVIAVGTTGGTSWIRTLQAGIEERDQLLGAKESLFSERIALQSDTHRRDLGLARERSFALERELTELRKSIDGFSKLVTEATGVVEEVYNSEDITPQGKAKLLNVRQMLRSQDQMMSQAVERAEAIADFARGLQQLEASRSHFRAELSSSPTRKLYAMLGILIGFWLLLLGTWLVIRRDRRRLLALRREASLRE